MFYVVYFLSELAQKKQPGFKKWRHDDSETSLDFIGHFITCFLD